MPGELGAEAADRHDDADRDKQDPANATMTLSQFTYLASFVRFDLSLGAAASWLMLLMSMLLCIVFMSTVRRRDAS